MTREEIINKIQNFTFADLTNQGNIVLLRQEMLSGDLKVSDCYYIAKTLEEKLKSLSQIAEPANHELHLSYLKVIAFLRLRCFFILTEAEAGQFMRMEVLKANQVCIEEDSTFDFIENIYTSLDAVFDWDRTKKTVLLENLKKNEEILGSNESNKYLKNWLKDYDLYSHNTLERTSLDRLEYLNNSPLVKSLSSLEKKVLGILLETYDTLRVFRFRVEPRKSMDYWANEAAMLQMNAEIEQPAGVQTANLQKLRVGYQQILSQLLPTGTTKKPASHEPEVVLDQLNNNLALRDVGAVIADLENLIQLKGLLKLLKSKNFLSDFIIYLEAHVGMGLEDHALRLTPETLTVFLQFLLVNKLQLSQENSAVLGLYLANVLAKQNMREFLPMVYGDLTTNTFKWREVIGENGKLRFK